MLPGRTHTNKGTCISIKYNLQNYVKYNAELKD